jgi:hypothetical protein
MWMLSLSGVLEGGASVTLPENHQLAAKSAARRKLPTQRKYCSNGMVREPQRR